MIERAIKKGSGTGDEKLVLEHVVFEGYAPHKVPVIVEVMTDNHNRTAPDMRVLFKQGQLGTAGSNKFLFDHVGIIEAHHPDAGADLEAAAIEAGANDFEPLTHEQNDDIPEGARRGALPGGRHGGPHGFAMADRQRLDRGDERDRLRGQKFPRADRRAAGRDGRVSPEARRLRRRARVWAAVK